MSYRSGFFRGMARLLLPGVGALLLSGLTFAQSNAPATSPVVHPDRTITFRFQASNAKEVFLALEGTPRLPMQKGSDGVWSVTTRPLSPDYYGYSFIADDVRYLDPANPVMKPNLLNTTSMILVADGQQIWEPRNVPRGSVNQHFYRSAAAAHMRDYFVYTPPGYRPDTPNAYPVLYLLHGFSDDARGWTQVGQAHVILDNLLAEGKIRPMVVVMPLGYGTMAVLNSTPGVPRDPAIGRRNISQFRTTLLEEVIPQVESLYNVRKDRAGRALAGLSMGGAETLFTALNFPERFLYVGAFSSGGVSSNYSETFSQIGAIKKYPFQLLWIACGVDDRLIEANRQFSSWLKEQQIPHEYVETEGAHTWMVWRRYLATFTQKIFPKE
jgi:enterochelin esterase-like enzyme